MRPIDILLLASTAVSPVAIPGFLSYTHSVVTPNDAGAYFQIGGAAPAGRTYGGFLSGSGSGTWLVATESPSNFEIYATSGDSPTGSALNVWLNLGTLRTWTKSRTVNVAGVNTASISFTIRRVGTTTPTWSFSALLTAEVT